MQAGAVFIPISCIYVFDEKKIRREYFGKWSPHSAYIFRTSKEPTSKDGIQDSKKSLAFLESDEWKRAIISIHVKGIINYLNNL